MSANESNKLITNGLLDYFDIANVMSNNGLNKEISLSNEKINSLSRPYKPSVPMAMSSPMTISLPSSGFVNLINGTTFSEQNKGVMNLDGMNDSVRLNISVTLSHLTYSIWYKPSSTDNHFRSLGQTGAWSTTEFACFSIGNHPSHPHQLSLRTKSSNGVTNTRLPGEINPKYYDTWHNATFVIEPSKQSIYYNGQLCKSTTRTNNSDITITRLAIGNSMGYGFFGGEIGPAAIYNRALSDVEIKHNYNVLKSRFKS
tara:strand:+ start:80 stop:850 length:771 start_codon:yes stop_codon:yes gene_type:complete